ncbi:MAG: ATP-binding protein [Acidimicrobiales bacterium]
MAYAGAGPVGPEGTWAPGEAAAELLAYLGEVEARVRQVLARRRAADPNPDDPHRGLYVTEERVHALTADRRPGGPATGEEPGRLGPEGLPPGSRLGALGRRFGLDGLDLDLLVLALAPDLDQRFEPIFGYLNDDVTRRRVTVGTALELCGRDPAELGARARLGPGGPLVSRRLVVVEDADRPALTRALRVPDAVAGWLLGDEALEGELADVSAPAVTSALEDAEEVKRAISAGVRLLYVRDTLESAAWSWLASAFAELAMPVVGVDLRLVAAAGDPAELAQAAARAADLRGGAVLLAHLDEVGGRSVAEARIWTALAAHTPVAATGVAHWDATWSSRPPLLLGAPELGMAQRRVVWEEAMGHKLADGAWRAVAAFRLTPEQVAQAARSAAQAGVAANRDTGPADLQRGARAQNAASLERLARRVEPRVGWADLVVPPDVEAALRGMVARLRQRARVLGDWGVGGAGARSRGLTALFAGESGTGKTLSAEVLAGELGLDLYVIDLSSVVDKYIGETEKNLDRIFTEAERVNGVLLFDEADAIFGKRSDVSDSKDRYANIEVAYLLQRMERFIGVAVLTTNLRANVDDAFLRRIDVIVDFPVPDEVSRLALWRHQCGPGLPLDDDVDLDFLARSFRLAGGSIANIVLGAAYLAADGGRGVAMADLVRATAGEYRKLGRLCLESEFGRWHHLVAGPSR